MSAKLVAAELGVPWVPINAAALSDTHRAASQLLGTTHGYVGSFKPALLEQVGKHWTGAVVEVMDPDHSPACKEIMDLLLTAFDEGFATTGAGVRIGLANVVFAVTINLPDGLDERIRNQTGFNRTQRREALVRRVEAEARAILSGAFVSRAGRPILFDTLHDQADLAHIAARAIAQAVRIAVDRAGMAVTDVAVAPNAGLRLVQALEANVFSNGARAVIEQARNHAAEAVHQFRLRNPRDEPRRR